ncbi:hypothetical protein [Variovorax rhizosphaerae]|uniref:Uncharacterized protein n=1 Tax=Variovorax rhizosphaerae TaxID=1836200 RepID=A0ABU8WSM8_9BURK
MADELLGDDPLGRNEAFFAALGIAERFYTPAVTASLAHATTVPTDAAALPWAPFGTRNIGGRVRALAQDPRNPFVLYAGTAMGGVFRTTDGGDTWDHIGQPEDAFAVGALAIDPNQPTVIYVGTGEPVSIHSAGAPITAFDAAAAGIGFLRCDTAAVPVRFTTEVGSWSGIVAAAQAAAATAGNPIPLPPAVPMANGAADRYSRIAFDPRNAGRCWIASSTGLWRREPGPPVSFFREPVPNPPPAMTNPAQAAFGCVATDVVIADNPAGARTYRLHVGFGAFGVFRGVWDPAVGGNAVWEAVPLGGGLPGISAPAGLTHDRIRLAVCRSFPDHVYAMFENGQPIGNPDPRAVLDIFHSANGGTTWTAGPALASPTSPASTIGDGIAVGQGGQPWAHMVIECHPDNPAIVVAGGINLALTRDFGANWQRIIHWPNFGDGDRSQHGDQHTIVFDSADPRRIWVGNDGGISMAPDIVQTNPLTDANWRKRSHGIEAAQFNDIAINPSHPTMVGGGLQDNASYITFGGDSWHVVSDADGGQMAFTINNPRTYIAPHQNAVVLSNVVAGSAMSPAPGVYPLVQRRRINGDLAPGNEFFAVQIAPIAGGATLFIPIVEQHRATANHFIVGRPGGVRVTANNGGIFVNPAIPAFGGGDASAIAYGTATNVATTDDWWVGTSVGVVHVAANAPPAAPAWANVTPPGVNPLSLIARIAVHPADTNYVAVATATRNPAVTAATPFPFRGQVFLSLDRGLNWADVTGLVSVGPPVAVPPLQALPPSPFTSLVFDPQPAAGAAQVLYCGTIAGAYVIRNLPPLRVPAAAGAVPAFNPQWFAFNARGAPGALPLTLIKDLALQTLPVNGGAAAGSVEAVVRQRLVAATYGRGMHVCDITNYAGPLAAGGPRHRLYIRQTVVESGLSYPRPAPATLNAAPAAAQPDQYGGDPRLPTVPAPLAFTDQDAYDIRIDNRPFQFFDDVMDGVEFDEDLRTRAVVPGESNAVYVQVHTSGWDALAPVTVHLYFAAAVAGAAPDLHTGFWATFAQDPLPAPAAVPVAPKAAWQRAGHPVTLNRIRANRPEVARFDWVPPLALAGGSVALLAACTSAVDAMPAAPSEAIVALLRAERRVALRVAAVGAFKPDLYIRDGVDDDGRLGGVAFGGRSPDIIVVEAAVVDPAAAFTDLGDARELDRVRGGGGNNVVYVRVHNRQPADTAVDVELFWALPNAPVSAAPGQSGPPFDATKWQVIAPVDAVNVTVPASGTRLARFDFNVAPVPEADFPNAIAFIALIRSHDSADPEPQRAGIASQDAFWRLFTDMANSNNAALRALRFL